MRSAPLCSSENGMRAVTSTFSCVYGPRPSRRFGTSPTGCSPADKTSQQSPSLNSFARPAPSFTIAVSRTGINATDAAQEFITFCQNRAWVFSDAGTTADGQRLYAFTHRTFLEYFAAAHLAAIHDTPEQLAAALFPRIARQEWEVVAQLAIQIKSASCDRGEERSYAALLGDGRQRRQVPLQRSVVPRAVHAIP